MSGAMHAIVRLRAGLVLAACLPAAFAWAGDGPGGAAPLLHALFQDHAVLQRDQPIRVWGQAPPGQELRVALAGQRVRVRAGDDGAWHATLPALRAGGPHVLVARAGDATQTVSDLLVGDVWLCSGQSNMELPVWRALDARAEIAGAGNDRIRLLSVPQAGSAVAQATFAAPVRWQLTTPASVREFLATCHFFARELQKAVDVPMGLVVAAWGGSRIEAWTSADALRALGGHDADLAVLARHAVDPVAAAGAWGERWARWWRERDGAVAGDTPWEAKPVRGAGWRPAPKVLGAWERWGVPRLADYNGMVWYRATVRLTAAQAAQPAVLQLGPADEMDMTWVNGRGVGSTYGAGESRAYRVPDGLLRAGENVVVVNVLDTWREGGLSGPASAHMLQLADGTRAPLAGWQYRIAPDGEPPRAPWQTAAGLSTLHNGMLAPLGGYGFRGALWYQGESNTGDGEGYAASLRGLRDDWRARFGRDLPLLVVQLAAFGSPSPRPADSGWATLREAQRRVVADDPRSGLAVAIDLGDRYDIHPPNKQELGRRLARAARHVVYGERLAPSGPVPRSTRREGDAVVVTFGDVSGGLVAYGAPGPIGFELCGAAPGSCRQATAQLRGDAVVLRASNAAIATRVRHAWADFPIVTLFDGAGLPAGPFEVALP